MQFEAQDKEDDERVKLLGLIDESTVDAGMTQIKGMNSQSSFDGGFPQILTPEYLIN